MRGEFEQIPVNVFAELGDVVVTADYLRLDIGYIAGGTTTETEERYTLDVIEGEITDSELSAGIALAGDRVFYAPSVMLPIEPVAKDRIIVAGVEYAVYRAVTDPARAMWEVYCR